MALDEPEKHVHPRSRGIMPAYKYAHTEGYLYAFFSEKASDRNTLQKISFPPPCLPGKMPSDTHVRQRKTDAVLRPASVPCGASPRPFSRRRPCLRKTHMLHEHGVYTSKSHVNRQNRPISRRSDRPNRRRRHSGRRPECRPRRRTRSDPRAHRCGRTPARRPECRSPR